MKKLSVVVGVLNQFDIAIRAITMMLENMVRDDVEFIVIDNGSDVPFPDSGIPKVRVIRNEINTGNYPLFQQGLKESEGEIIAFLHSDVFVYQRGWDEQVISQFDSRPEMGLIGFIGSTELDNWGGRGMGTVSNMQGKIIPHKHDTGNWTGSPAHVHGAVSAGMTVDGSVVDGCVMIFRKSVLEKIEVKNIPPHHFYDRIMSCQVIEAGYKVGILGIEFDHISGQTANTQGKWQDTSKNWFIEHLGIHTPQEWATLREDWVKRGRNSPSLGKVPDQWDYAAYLEAEYQFLTEYRDNKRIVPLVMGKRVN